MIGTGEAYRLIGTAGAPASAVTDTITSLYDTFERREDLQDVYKRIHETLETPVRLAGFPPPRRSVFLPGLGAPLRDGLAALWLSCEEELGSARSRQRMSAVIHDETQLREAVERIAVELDPAFLQEVMERSARRAVRNADTAEEFDRALGRIKEEALVLISRSVGTAALYGAQDDPPDPDYNDDNYDPGYGDTFTICEFSSGSDFWTIFWCILIIIVVIILIIIAAAA